MIDLDLKCLEWLNMNKSARAIAKSKKAKEAAAAAAAAAATKKNKKNDKPSTSTTTSDSSPTLINYLLQIAGSHGDQEYLACLSSNQVVNVYGQVDLSVISKISNYQTELGNDSSVNLTEIGFFKNSKDMIFGCTDRGRVECWDLRTVRSEKCAPEIQFQDLSREFLTVDINCDDNLLIVGTNKSIDDALVYIYDIRMTGENYMLKFCESHSNDVTQVRFDPFCRNKFVSASLDGLVCFYDLELKPEGIEEAESDANENDESESDDDSSLHSDTHDDDPDLMDQVLNADSSVQKIGYLCSSNSSRADQLYAITFTNDLFVWDLNTFDTVYKKQSKNKNVPNGELIDENDDREEDYYFGCFYYRNELTVCMGDKDGRVRLYRQDALVFETDKETTTTPKRYHRDIIRSSYWNEQSLFTAGEDGFLYKWQVTNKLNNAVDTNENEAVTASKRNALDETVRNSGDELETSGKPEKKKKRKPNTKNKKKIKYKNK